MKKISTIKLDNWTKGLLVIIINKAISCDKDLTSEDINKLKAIKKELQGSIS